VVEAAVLKPQRQQQLELVDCLLVLPPRLVGDVALYLLMIASRKRRVNRALFSGSFGEISALLPHLVGDCVAKEAVVLAAERSKSVVRSLFRGL
jgi:hypothetical protein